jgi:hypothetical protein
VITGFRIQRDNEYWIGLVLKNNKIKFVKVSDSKIGKNADFLDSIPKSHFKGMSSLERDREMKRDYELDLGGKPGFLKVCVEK